MKKLLALLLTGAMLLPVFTGAFAESTADPLDPYRTGTPWLCVDLDGIVTEDTTAQAGENFALFANRSFYLNTSVPLGYITRGTMNDVSMMNEADILALFDGTVAPESRDAQMAQAMFGLVMDWDSRNRAGMRPFSDQVELVDAVTSVEELNRYLLETDVMDVMEAPFYANLMVDPMNPDAYAAVTGYPALIMDDPAEYASRTGWGQIVLDARTDLTLGLLVHMGYSPEEAQRKCDNAFAFECLAAPLMYTAEETGSPGIYEQALNYLTRDEMLSMQGDLPIVQTLEDLYGFGRQETWIVTSPRFLQGMQEIYTDENIELIKDWMICTFLRKYAEYMDRTCYDLTQQCRTAITGADPLSEDTNALYMVEQFLPWQLSRLYCETYFTSADKEELTEIIQAMIGVYRSMLENTDLLSEETRAAAIGKLDSMSVFCLYPDDWSVYIPENLTFATKEEGGTLYGALRQIAMCNLERQRERFAGPASQHDPMNDIPPIVCNCCYNASNNSLNILAGFCRGGIYRSDMTREEKLGKICMVVGHEIAHAFDPTGSQFDETGAYANWWTEEDLAAFNARVARLERYLSTISLWEGEPVDGSIKAGDACADITAMQCILALAARIPDFDYDLFFRSYADLLASVNDLFLIQIMQMDQHPQDYIRINVTVQQFDEFLACYGVTEGDAMYLAPADRVLIW